ncbi:MAG: hypothetical protein Q8Q81_17780 [Oxalobacteraceae bacterium]|nr:hypothetical protein [Oxalobacteraceae bacterium]
MKRLVLIGGGHAHLSVLQALAREKSADIDVVLVTPGSHQNYSGMLPGWMAGHYTQPQCRIDLQPRQCGRRMGMALERPDRPRLYRALFNLGGSDMKHWQRRRHHECA